MQVSQNIENNLNENTELKVKSQNNFFNTAPKITKNNLDILKTIY